MAGRDPLQDAIARHRGGDLAGAERLYREILSRRPECAEALRMLGVLKFQRGDGAAGVELVREAIGLDSGHAAYHIDLGEMLMTRGQLRDAADAYRRAIELAPEEAATHNNLGITLQMLGDIHGAIAAFEAALGLAPEFAPAVLNLGDSLRRSGRLQAAADVFERALAINPDFYEARVNLGSCLLGLGRVERAIECLGPAVERWPSRPEAHVALGNCLHIDSRHEEALDCYRHALGIDADALEAHMGVGAVCEEKDALDEAVAAYREVLRIEPAHVDSRVNLAFLEARRGNVDEVERICRETFALANASPSAPSEPDFDHAGVAVESDLNFALGKAHDHRGNHDRAFHHFARANRLHRARIEHDPASGDEFVNRSLAIFDSALLNRLRAAGNPDERPMFIVGMPHSGKTLVEQILSSTPLVHGAGELEFFPDIMISTGGGTAFIDWVRTLSVETARRITRGYLALLIDTPSGAQRVTNTMPDNFLCLGLIGALFPNAAIVSCERDPRDSGLSIYFEKFESGNEYAYDLHEIGRYYAQYRSLMAHWRSLMPERIITVRYEDLVADQLPETRRLLDACGLEWDERCLDFHKHPRPIRITRRWKVRQPVHSRFIGRWKHYSRWIGPLEKCLKETGGYAGSIT